MDLWLFPDNLPQSDGVSAGAISQLIGAGGVPGDVTLQSNPTGLVLTGNQDEISVTLGTTIVPDTSFNVNKFLDLNMHGIQISVGWPVDMCISPAQVLAVIQSALGTAGTSLNSAVLTKMEGILVAEGLPKSSAKKFLTKQVSVTFWSTNFPRRHSWTVSDTSDKTIVVTANPCIGWPRKLTSEPEPGF